LYSLFILSNCIIAFNYINEFTGKSIIQNFCHFNIILVETLILQSSMGLFFCNRQFSELAVYAAAGSGYVSRIGLAASPDRRWGWQLIESGTPSADPVGHFCGRTP
jgi:hypothetical protein